MTEFKIGDKVWVKGVINQIDKGNVWDLYISTRENGVWIDSRLDECIPQNDTDEKPRYLRNVLARLRGLPEHDRKVWMDEIMHEFANDYGSVKYTLGYEQGKFDGALEAEKPNKVVLTKEEAEYLNTFGLSNKHEVRKAIYFISRSGWGYSLQNGYGDRNEGLLAKITHDEDDENSTRTKLIKAVLFGYDVEPEKRYAVMLCNGQSLKKVYRQGDDYLDFKMGYDNFDNFTKQQLEDAGFGWVFDCEGVEVQEVE